MMYCCSLCDNPYSIESSLKRHMMKKHPEAVVPIKKKLECSQCDKSFNSRSGLKKHEESKHNKCYEKRNEKNVKCSECSYKCNNLKDLCSHIGNAHNVEIQKEYLYFDSMEEFFAWKEKIELDSKSAFVKKYAGNQVPTGKASFFYCNRSGYHKNESNNKRRLKKQGSCKINAFCCAHIKLKTTTDGKLLAEFVKTHTGHNLELCHLRLKQSEREMLAEKIARKIPFRNIIKEMRQTSSNSTCRVKLVTSRDLYNIQCSYGLDTSNGDLKRKDEKTSSKPLIHELKQSGYKIAYEFPTLENQDFFVVIQDESQVQVLQHSVPPSTATSDKSQFNTSLEKLKKELNIIANSLTNEAEIKVASRIIETVKPTLEAMRGNTSPANFQIKSNLKEGKIPVRKLYTLKENKDKCSKSPLKNQTHSEKRDLQ